MSLTESSEKSEKNILNDDISYHKYNLFQQFFVIGLDPKISYNLYNIDFKHYPNELLTPKVISIFPNKSLPYINIPNSFVASHCFPKGILDKIIYFQDGELAEKYKQNEQFVFSLDNLVEKDYDSSLRINKLYYNCLLFYEKVENFNNFSNYRRKMSFKSEEILEKEKNKNILIPKVICFSSFSPLITSASKILFLIKEYCDRYNFESLFDKDNFYPIENIIEGLLYNIPGLPRGNFKIRLDIGAFYDENDLQKNDDIVKSNAELTNKKHEMIIEESPINKSPKAIINYSLLMTFFTVEELFDIIRSIILEEPILFFSDNITNLTYTIEGILALIYPLTYQYPVISVLPEENFSLITIFYHFIFGINYKFSNELWKEKFSYLGDKQKIVIIPIEKRFPNYLNEIEKERNTKSIIITKRLNVETPLVQLAKLVSYKNMYKNLSFEKISEQNKKQTKLPIHYSSKCIKRLEPLIITKIKEEKIKKNRELNKSEKEKICNKEIIDNFLYFFTCILLNYQEYIKIKYEKFNNPQLDFLADKDIIIYKIPKEIEDKYLNDELKITDMFNTSGFISNTPTLDHDFYEKFLKTKIFFNFIKKKIFPKSVLDKLDVLFFDEKINEKLSREIKFNKIETKFLEDKIEVLSAEINIDSWKKELSNEITEFLENRHNRERGLNYFQYIIKDDNGLQRKKISKNNSKEIENNSEDCLNNNDTINELGGNKNVSKFKFYYFVFPKLLNDGIFFRNKKTEKNEENKYRKYNSKCFYNILEKEGLKIVNNPLMTNNYKNYSYSLIAMTPKESDSVNYINSINRFWLLLLAKTLYYIPNNKRSYYLYQIIQFLRENQKTIDENILMTLFKAFNKYGDRNTNQDFFVNFSRKNKTYISFLFLKEKVKKINNYIDYSSIAEKNIKIENKIKFFINSYCTDIEDNKDQENKTLYNVCGKEINNIDLSSLFNENDKYINFKCDKVQNKSSLKQPLIISCFYEKEEGLKYQINFRLISPAFILKQNWFKNSENINIDFMRKKYLDYYLSAIFYFCQQGLNFDFLLPKSSAKRELLIENIKVNQDIISTNIKKEEIEKKEDEKKEGENNEKEENKLEGEIIKKEEENKIKNEDFQKNLLMDTNEAVDLGGFDFEFGTSPSPKKKKNTDSKKITLKKKEVKQVKVSEFKMNIDEKK